jgi:hypothetical protein
MGSQAAAVEAPDVLLDKLVGRRPDDAAVDHQVLEIAPPGFCWSRRMAGLSM